MASPGIWPSEYRRRDSGFMLNSLPGSLLIGAALGFLAGLGVGGGTLLMLWLTMVLETAYPTARAVNLLFFLAAAGGVSILRVKKGVISLKNILPAILTGCLLATITAWLGKTLQLQWIQKPKS